MAEIEVFVKLYLEADYPGKQDKCIESPLLIARAVSPPKRRLHAQRTMV